MKKLFVFVLTLAMVFGLAACKEPANIRGEYEGGDPTKATAASTEPTEAVSAGRVNANKYTNTFAGITCELGADWTFKTDEEIRQTNETTLGILGEEYEELLKTVTTFTDMYATHSNGTDTVNIIFEKMSGVNRLLTEEKYVEISKDTTKGALESAGMTNVTLTVGKDNFAGEEHAYMDVAAEYMGVALYERMIVLRCGDYAVVVTACTWNTDTCEAILDNFKAVEK